MDAYDAQRPDDYARHLAELDASGGAVASHDIHNEDGTLLVKKGFSIRPETVKRLLNHKLVQPLETSVSMENALDGQQLFDDMLAMLRADEESQAVHRFHDLDKLLRSQCRHYEQYPLIVQKVTVLAARLKGEYAKALFCAWFSLALAHQMRLSDDEQADAFLAGLVHDTGLLHIDPSIVEKAGDYTPQEWRTLQSHSLIADTFLSYVDKLSAGVRLAVRQHHERCDGSGYPAALFGDRLSLLGQVVAMADTVWALSKKPVGRKARSLADVLTIVKMNEAQHPPAVHSALYRLYRGAGLATQPEADAEPDPAAGQQLLSIEQQLCVQFRATDQLHGLLPAQRNDRLVRSAHFKLERLSFVVNSSGLLSEAIAEWLTQLETSAEQVTAYEAREMSLMYGELQWQLRQLGRALELVLNRPEALNSQARTRLQSVIEGLSNGEGPSSAVEPAQRQGPATVS